MRALRFILATVTAFAAMTAPALAEDFTVRVPVEIRNTPHLTAAYVTCRARTATNAAVGSGRATIPLVDGAYTGELTVAFNASDGATPISAASINCVLTAYIRAADGRSVDASYMTVETTYETVTGQLIETYRPGGTVTITR